MTFTILQANTWVFHLRSYNKEPDDGYVSIHGVFTSLKKAEHAVKRFLSAYSQKELFRNPSYRNEDEVMWEMKNPQLRVYITSSVIDHILP